MAFEDGVTIYSKNDCVFCDMAKALLSRRSIPFKEVNLEYEDEATWRDLSLRSGLKTVPQIFYKNKLIGGFRELSALDKVDELESLK